jgi:signal transduction histidine kinase
MTTKRCAAIASAHDDGAITIDDDGPAIPETELAKVFQPFYRVEDSRGRDTVGLGIAQAIVQAQGGELTLANRPGGGLRATIKLPT